MRISKEIQFDMGHRVPFHDSKCKHPHGHRYIVEMTVAGEVVPDDAGVNDSGMVMDFGHLKTLLTELVHDPYDHAFVYWVNDPVGPALFAACEPIIDSPRVFSVDFVPTAERLAQHFFEVLEPAVVSRYGTQLYLDEVVVWETPTSLARFSRDDWVELHINDLPDGQQTLEDLQ